MNIIIFFLLLLSSVSSNTKICVNCRYFVKNSIFTGDEYGRCKMYLKEQDNIAEYLVTGAYKNIEKDDYYYCSTARGSEQMCGKQGKNYKKKYERKLGNMFNNISDDNEEHSNNDQ